MIEPISNAERRELKAKAQRLEPILKIGLAGASDSFMQSLDVALAKHGLVKVKFAAFKEEKKTLAPEIAERSGSELITRVGNVAVFYRRSTEG
jgi:RNA-binding protein